MLISTSYNPSDQAVCDAQQLATELDSRYVNRDNNSLEKLRLKYGDSDILLVSGNQLKYIHGRNKPLFFHPGMAYLRLKRLSGGESDPLLEAVAVKSGDSVLDCTAGLAADAIVLAHAVGTSGSVIALESEKIIATLLKWGIHQYEAEFAPVNDALRRIQVRQEDHLTYLQRQANRSVDIIYFDPMFRQPPEESPSMTPLRGAAKSDQLSLAAIDEACRVGRKAVVLKEIRRSPEFSRLGFTYIHGTYSKIAYGVIRL